MTLHLCVVGCGGFAETFSQAMQFAQDTVELSFASRDQHKSKSFAERFSGRRAFGSYEEAAADPDVEAMYICTPHHLHRDHAIMAAQARKHVLVEKPIARTEEEAGEIIAAANKAGVTLMVAENYRYMSPVRKARNLINSGAIGSLRMVQTQEEGPFNPQSWRNSPGFNGGGVLIDGGIHKLDILCYLGGAPVNVYAARLPREASGVQAEDGVVIVTRTAEGVVSLANHSRSSVHRSHPMWVSVSGTGGTLYFEVGKPWIRMDDGTSEQVIDLEGDHYGLVPMAREFRDSIREGREPETSGPVGLLDLMLVLKAYESIEKGTSQAIS